MNSALVDNKDVLSPPFLCSRFSRNNNLVFTTGFNHNNLDYDAYLPIICNALASIGPATAVINEQWSKFLVHGVPTYTTMTEIREIVEMQYKNLTLGQTPQWLLPKDKVEEKESSTVVLALIGKVSMSNIRIKEFVFGNTTCRITEYYPYDEATQCRRCQQYGHPTQLCKGETQVACAVCAQPHLTKEHPCKFPNCQIGPACKHPPIKCAACNGLQGLKSELPSSKSSFPTCKRYAKSYCNR
jgi:hypothetical protein